MANGGEPEADHSPTEVELRDGSVDGIELPTDTEDVRVALTEAWGQPYIDDVAPGCGRRRPWRGGDHRRHGPGPVHDPPMSARA